MLPISFVILIFSIWMVFDAIRRSAELYWYFIILLVPFGAFIYFFAVKLHDFDLRRVTAGRSSSQPLSVLRQRATHAPSPANQMALADALCQTETFREAAQLYQTVLDDDPKNKAALLGLARSSVGQGRMGDAVESFERLLELDRAYANYSAALEYAEALWQDGRKQDTVELLEAVAQLTDRPNHKLAHAHYLIRMGRPEDAHAIVDDVLQRHESAPPAQRKRNEKWAERARALLAELDAE